MKWLQWSLIVFLNLFFPLLQARDFELWTLAKFGFDLKDSWETEIHFSARFDHCASRAHLYYGEFHFLKSFSNGWKLVPGYRHTYRRNDSGVWKNDPIALLAVIKTQKINALIITHRSRLEHRFENNRWLFRQRLTLTLPLFLSRFKFKPYFYDEVFFLEGFGFHQHRFFFGLKKQLSKKEDVSLGYLLRENRRDKKWIATNVLYLIGNWSF